VSVTQGNAERIGGVDASIHTGDNEILLRGRQGQVPSGKGGGVALRRGLDVLLDGSHSYGWFGLRRSYDAGLDGQGSVQL
jgi:hypothetical protein